MRSNEFGLSIEYTTHITWALRISDSKCDLSCGLPYVVYVGVDHKTRTHNLTRSLTARIDDVCCHVLWSNFWRDGDLWDDVLDLCNKGRDSVSEKLYEAFTTGPYMSDVRFLDE